MPQIRKRRGFTKVLLFWILLLVVLPVIGFQIYYYYNSNANLRAMEEEKSQVSNRTAQRAIENLGEAVLGITVTNAYWDEHRSALEHGDIQWIKDNISDMPDIVPNVDFVAEADMQGNVIVRAGNVKELTSRVEYPVILERFTKEPKFWGVLNTSRGAAVVAISAITDEKATKPPVGMLIAGRLLTGDILQSLSKMLQTNISILTESHQYLSSDGGLGEPDLNALFQKVETGKDSFRMDRSNGQFAPQYTSRFFDMAGDPIGVIQTQTSAVSATQAMDDTRNLLIYVVAIMAILVTLVIYMLRRRIMLPLRHFRILLSEVAAGKHIETIPKHVLQAEAEIVQAFQQIMRWNQMLERTVEIRTAEIRNLLDHTRQGFLSFGADLRVKDQYSVECVRLLGGQPSGRFIHELLYPVDPDENLLLQSILKDYFLERDSNAKELIFSLLPDELRIGERTVKAEFVPIVEEGGEDGPQKSVMVMLTDLSETRRLEDQMLQERRILQMVVQTVTHPEDYTNITKDFEQFHQCEIWERMEDRDSPQDKAMAIYRTIHTFKGNFGFLNFLHVVPKLHELESELQHRMKEPELNDRDLSEFLRQQNLQTWLEPDLDVLRSVLGSSYHSLLLEQGVKLDRRQWQEIEDMMNRTLVKEEDRQWLEKVRTWRYRPAQWLFKPYSEYLKELADRNGILLHPMVLQGGDIPVDPERLYGFARSFVHIVRNAVVHGIESPDERIARGKDEYGTVTLAVEHAEEGIRITFADDGRGIDPEALKQQAAVQGISTGGMTEEQTLRLIFEDQLSTSEQVTNWSGRGVGLSVVKDEVEQLGGKIEIRSQKGFGTSFIFQIPAGNAKGDQRLGA
jgi:two-component system, chemotaxis family, sensor kinase CheA